MMITMRFNRISGAVERERERERGTVSGDFTGEFWIQSMIE